MDGPVGVICNADHPVMSDVADRLRARGISVRFFEPGVPLTDDELAGLGVLVNKKVRPASLRTLHRADRTGVPTWAGFLATTVCSCRLVALTAMEGAGLRVPPVHFTPPDGPYVAKGRFSWRGDVALDETGDFYQELVETEPVDHKYYCVHDGQAWRTSVLRVTSKLYGEKEHLGRGTPDPALVERVTDLADRLDSRTLGVDFVRSDGDWYAVDVNAAPSFRDAGMEAAIADSIATLGRPSP